MLTLKTVNRKLESLGVEERLCYSKEFGYFYFSEGASSSWFTTIVGGVFRLNQLTLDQWVSAYHELAKS